MFLHCGKMNTVLFSLFVVLLIKQKTYCRVLNRAKVSIMSSSDIVASMFFSDARTISAYIHCSRTCIERRRFFMIRKGQIPPDPTSWKPAQNLVSDQVSNLLAGVGNLPQTSRRQVANKLESKTCFRQVGSISTCRDRSSRFSTSFQLLR